MKMSPDITRNIYYRHFDITSGFPVIGLLGNNWQVSPEPVTRLHFHNCLEIGYCYSGSGNLYIGDEIVPFSSPSIQIIPPNLPHINQSDPGQDLRAKWLYTDPSLLIPSLSPRLHNELRDYQNSLAGRACVIDGAQHEDMLHLIEMIIHEMEERKAHYQRVVRELFHAFFLLLIRDTDQTASVSSDATMRISVILPAISYVAENYMNEIDIETLARICHLSVSHFRRIFKQVLGVAPLEYIQTVRIERARVLLFNQDLSVTEIGMQVGFPTPSSFIRQFHQLYGLSPGQWRKKAHNEENPAVLEYFRQMPYSTQQFFPQEYDLPQHMP